MKYVEYIQPSKHLILLERSLLSYNNILHNPPTHLNMLMFCSVLFFSFNINNFTKYLLLYVDIHLMQAGIMKRENKKELEQKKKKKNLK